MVFSANPEDYTSRGNIITPLKDRLDSQILTHYPKSIETGIQITKQEAFEDRHGTGPSVRIPHFLREIIEQVAFEARASEYVDHRSGVSARMTRAALEVLISTAERRALLCGESRAVARISDLLHLETAITGKVELVYEGEREGARNVARLLMGRAVKTIFGRYFPDPGKKGEARGRYKQILDWFASNSGVTMDSDMPRKHYAAALRQINNLGAFVKEFLPSAPRSEQLSYMEFVLEALHQHSLLSKEVSDNESIAYTDLVGTVLSSITEDEDQ